MSTFVEYKLDKNSTILIEGLEEIGAPVKASRGGIKIVEAEKKFSEALKGAGAQAELLINEIEKLHVEEAEIKFGLITTGELGNIAIGKIGLAVNYEVTLKWKMPEVKK